MTGIGRLKYNGKGRSAGIGETLVSTEIIIAIHRLAHFNNLIRTEVISSTVALVNSRYHLNIRVGTVNAPALKPQELCTLENIKERNLGFRLISETWLKDVGESLAWYIGSELNINRLRFMWPNRKNKRRSLALIHFINLEY